MLQQFINRKQELRFLEEKYNSGRSELILIYGRRRVGKTELIKRFIQNKPNSVYFLATKESVKENINQLKEVISKKLNLDYFRDLKINNFVKLFYYLSKELNNKKFTKKFILVIDEFPYLIEKNKNILTQFQKAWDEFLKDKNIMLILTGSSIGVMTELMQYSNPLYGRRTGQYEIKPMMIKDLLEYFNVDFEELIKIYGVIGGIPSYFIQLNKDSTLDEALKTRILKKGEFLYEEPLFLLNDELRELRVYLMILKYISLGYNTFGKLTSVIGLDKGNISKYLYRLEQLGLIENVLPFGKRKGGIFKIKDYFFNFWFRFVYVNKNDLELGLVNEVFKRIKKEFNEFFGRVFEDIILELIRTKQILLDFSPLYVGKWWYKDKEIDGIIVNDLTKKIAFIECKWKSNVNAERIIKELREKAKYVQWYNNERKEYYYIFAKSFRNKVNKKNIKCIDIKELKDLILKSNITNNNNI